MTLRPTGASAPVLADHITLLPVRNLDSGDESTRRSGVSKRHAKRNRSDMRVTVRSQLRSQLDQLYETLTRRVQA
jgi:putative lipoic acid-binding regulatory protein